MLNDEQRQAMSATFERVIADQQVVIDRLTKDLDRLKADKIKQNENMAKSLAADEEFYTKIVQLADQNRNVMDSKPPEEYKRWLLDRLHELKLECRERGLCLGCYSLHCCGECYE